MKRTLAKLILIMSFMFLAAPMSFAADDAQKAKVEQAQKETSSFNVFDIFSFQTEPEADSGVNGDFQLLNDLEPPKGNERPEINTNKDPDAADSGGIIFALIIRVINILTLFVGTFAFIMIIVGGFFFATATEESRIDKGKAILTQAIVGLVIAFMSYFIVSFVQSLLI